MMKISVIESKGKVIARLDNCSMDAYNILRKRLPSYMTIDADAVKMKNTFKGIAKCHPDDVFDAEKGAEIAKARVVAKYNAAISKVLNKVGNDVDTYLEYVDSRLEFFED